MFLYIVDYTVVSVTKIEVRSRCPWLEAFTLAKLFLTGSSLAMGFSPTRQPRPWVDLQTKMVIYHVERPENAAFCILGFMTLFRLYPRGQ